MLQELRRGLEYVQVYSISFDLSGQWLALSSDSETIHIFNIKQTEQEKEEFKGQHRESKNPKSM